MRGMNFDDLCNDIMKIDNVRFAGVLDKNGQLYSA